MSKSNRGVFVSLIFVFIAKGVLSWTVNFHEVKKQFSAKINNGTINEQSMSNETLLALDNQKESSQNTYESDPEKKVGYVDDIDSHFNGNYADKYEYQSYMEKKVHDIVHSGSQYLDDLSQSLDNYGRLFNTCSHQFTFTDHDLAKPLKSEYEQAFEVLKSPADKPTFCKCLRVTKSRDQVRKLAALALWASKELENFEDDGGNKQPADLEEHEKELLLRLAWFLDRLAKLTGFQPRTKALHRPENGNKHLQSQTPGYQKITSTSTHQADDDCNNPDSQHIGTTSTQGAYDENHDNHDQHTIHNFFQYRTTSSPRADADYKDLQSESTSFDRITTFSQGAYDDIEDLQTRHTDFQHRTKSSHRADDDYKDLQSQSTIFHRKTTPVQHAEDHNEDVHSRPMGFQRKTTSSHWTDDDYKDLQSQLQGVQHKTTSSQPIEDNIESRFKDFQRKTTHSHWTDDDYKDLKNQLTGHQTSTISSQHHEDDKDIPQAPFNGFNINSTFFHRAYGAGKDISRSSRSSPSSNDVIHLESTTSRPLVDDNGEGSFEDFDSFQRPGTVPENFKMFEDTTVLTSPPNIDFIPPADLNELMGFIEPGSEKTVKKRSLDSPLVTIVNYYIKHKVWDGSNPTSESNARSEDFNAKNDITYVNNRLTDVKPLKKRSIDLNTKLNHLERFMQDTKKQMDEKNKMKVYSIIKS